MFYICIYIFFQLVLIVDCPDDLLDAVLDHAGVEEGTTEQEGTEGGRKGETEIGKEKENFDYEDN